MVKHRRMFKPTKLARGLQYVAPVLGRPEVLGEGRISSTTALPSITSPWPGASTRAKEEGDRSTGS
jgi:hypothetical protein